MTWRKVLFRALAVMAFPAIVVIGLNVENVAHERGWDQILSQNWRWVLDALVAASWAVVGGLAVLWLDRSLRRGDVEDDKVDPHWERKLEVVEGKFFHLTDVPLDHRKYVNCRFEDITLVYDGAPFALKNNHFSGRLVVKTNRADLGRFAQLLFSTGGTKANLLTPEGRMSLEEFDRQNNNTRITSPTTELESPNSPVDEGER
jgi:hypothetical protein